MYRQKAGTLPTGGYNDQCSFTDQALVEEGGGDHITCSTNDLGSNNARIPPLPPQTLISKISKGYAASETMPFTGSLNAGADHMTAGLLITAAPRWINSSSLGHENLSHAGMSGSPTLLKANTDVSLSQPLAFSHVRDGGLNGTAASGTPMTKRLIFIKHCHVARIYTEDVIMRKHSEMF